MNELVSISVERLKELEALEASIPSMIENAVQEYKKANLKKLHERDKANPAAINMRVKRYIERHREEINKKRREKRQQQKLEKLAKLDNAENVQDTVIKTCDADTSDTTSTDPVKVESIFMRAAVTAVSKSDNPVIRKRIARRKKPIENTEGEGTDASPASTMPDRISDITVRFDI
jgi:hypothetical protein